MQGVQEVRSGRAGVRALRSVGSGPGTVTELLRNIPERTQTTLFRAAALPVPRNNKPKDEAPRLAKTPVL